MSRFDRFELCSSFCVKMILRVGGHRCWHRFPQPLTGKLLVRSFLLCSVLLVCSSPHAYTDAEVESALADIVAKTNRTLPSGPEYARVIGLYAGPGRRLTISAITNNRLFEWTPQMIADSRLIALDSYCRDPGMHGFQLLDLTVAWQLSDLAGRYITTNTISPGDCRATKTPSPRQPMSSPSDSDAAYNRAVVAIEAKHPVLNVDSPRYNRALDKQVAERMQVYRQAGSSRVDALKRSVMELVPLAEYSTPSRAQFLRNGKPAEPTGSAQEAHDNSRAMEGLSRRSGFIPD